MTTTNERQEEIYKRRGHDAMLCYANNEIETEQRVCKHKDNYDKDEAQGT